MVSKKIQKSGNSYSIYLPSAWIKKNGAREIEIIEELSGDLLIKAHGKREMKEPSKEIHLPQYNFDIVNMIIGRCYQTGYERFKLIFEKKLDSKEILKHQKSIKELGLDIGTQSITPNSITFYCGKFSGSPLIIFKNIIEKAVNFIRAKEQNEEELSEHFKKEIWRDCRIIRRIFITSTKSSEFLAEFNIKLETLWEMDMINHYIKELIISASKKMSKEELNKIKTLFGKIPSADEKIEFKTLIEYHTLSSSIKTKEIERISKQLERHMLSLWLAQTD